MPNDGSLRLVGSPIPSLLCRDEFNKLNEHNYLLRLRFLQPSQHRLLRKDVGQPAVLPRPDGTGRDFEELGKLSLGPTRTFAPEIEIFGEI